MHVLPPLKIVQYIYALMPLKNKNLLALPGCALLLFFFHKLPAQYSIDSAACLTRFEAGKTRSFTIPMTRFCLVKNAGLGKDYSNGWIMKWDVIEKPSSNLLFMEMNSTDVAGWLVNSDINGSVQLVFELPGFGDSIALTGLTNKSKGLHSINNYGGISAKKEYLGGNLAIVKGNYNTFIRSSLHLTTENPGTQQQFILDNVPVQSFTFPQYQEMENTRDSIREAEQDMMVNALTQSIALRDSLWEIENSRIRDSLQLHPYTGKFRFWVSNVDKAGYSRITYSVDHDSLVIKEGPYDFIYLAKNYQGDSVYFKKALNRNEKALLAVVGQRIGSDSLEDSYNNRCFMDGLILCFSFESAAFSKDVTVSNYYNESIAFVLNFINKIAPEQYRLWYDKKILVKQQRACSR
jgi:hypothetical protein